MQKVRKAVIPVAGLGTRFLPVTKAIPKELLPLVDKPVIQYIVEEARDSGIEEIIFVTNEEKQGIERYFAQDTQLECVLADKRKDRELQAVQDVATLAKYVFVPQLEPLGLGHAVLQARELIGNEPFMVFGGDDVVEGKIPAARELIEVYEKFGGSVVGVTKVPESAIGRYGIIDPSETVGDDTVKVQDILEKPSADDAPSNLGVAGRWLLTPEIFPLLTQVAPGAGDEIQLTDAIRELVKVQPVYAKTYSGVYRDCGNKAEYLKAVISFALKHEQVSDDVKQFIRDLDV